MFYNGSSRVSLLCFCMIQLPYHSCGVKFKDPNFKHAIFVRIDMKHSYISNYFITCLQSIFYCLLFAKIYSCLCIIFVLKLNIKLCICRNPNV